MHVQDFTSVAVVAVVVTLLLLLLMIFECPIRLNKLIAYVCILLQFKRSMLGFALQFRFFSSIPYLEIPRVSKAAHFNFVQKQLFETDGKSHPFQEVGKFTK